MTDESDIGDDESLTIDEETQRSPRDRLEAGAEQAVEQLDEGVIDLLDWVLETDTRTRIYVQLRKEPNRTSEELAEATGLYPSTVREALAELTDDGIVSRSKRPDDGAGNNPYEYTAIPPSELVSEVVQRIQTQLNAVVNLDRLLRPSEPTTDDDEPITISISDPEPDDSSDEEDPAGKTSSE